MSRRINGFVPCDKTTQGRRRSSVLKSQKRRPDTQADSHYVDALIGIGKEHKNEKV